MTKNSSNMGLLPRISIPEDRECVLPVPRFIPFKQRPDGWLTAIRLERTQYRVDWHKNKAQARAKTEKKVQRTKAKKTSSLLGMLTLEQMKAAGFIKE